jgi:hypothetical protein
MRQPIPDPPNGVRFCRKCNEFHPIADFPEGKRRHECKVCDLWCESLPLGNRADLCQQAHIWKRASLSSKKTLKSPDKKALRKIWQYAWVDSESLLGKRDIHMNQAEIMHLFKGSDIELDADKYRVVPRNPHVPLTVENAKIVSPGSRRTLVAMWKIAKTGDCEVSAMAVEWLSQVGRDEGGVSVVAV